MSDTESIYGVAASLFEVPEDFYKPPPPPSSDVYHRKPEFVKDNEPTEITLRLVGKSPLWGHLLWNASKVTGNWLDQHGAQLCAGKTVLEVGAGAALPSFICAIQGARKIVITDYPETELIENIEYNVEKYVEDQKVSKDLFAVDGYIWGNDTKPLLDLIPGDDGYDLIILSDVVFNHSEHAKLLATCWQTLSHKNKDAKIFVVFTPHRAKLFHRDLKFFDDAKEMGFEVEKLFEEKWWPMFVEEEETKELRSMVYGYYLSF
ncbi:hypothetical protein V1512DRAFT_219628 [Lipomyces arxii]|uniref:uncharacterized protein n=1 Tax=Lipomyces arxii TaxID=56418 RepID=UPI0034CF5F4B